MTKNLNSYVTFFSDLTDAIKELSDNAPNKKAIIQQAQGMRIFIEQFQANKEVSNQLSYQNLMRMEIERLKELLQNTDASDKLSDDDQEILHTQLQAFKQLSPALQQHLDTYIPEDLNKQLPKILLNLPWIEGSSYLSFTTPEGLAQIVAGICEARMAMADDSVTFEIYLPPLSQSDAEEMKNTGETRKGRASDYAKSAFAAAAKKGIHPDKCKLIIDGVPVSPKESDLTGMYESWVKEAEKTQKQAQQESWKNTFNIAPPELEEPEQTSSSLRHRGR